MFYKHILFVLFVELFVYFCFLICVQYPAQLRFFPMKFLAGRIGLRKNFQDLNFSIGHLLYTLKDE